MVNIKEIFGREILDSRGQPTIEVVASDGVNTVSASVPNGGEIVDTNEVCDLHDQDLCRHQGKGVLKALSNINGPIKSAITGSWDSIVEIDHRLKLLDGSENLSRLGANTLFAVSLACLRLFAVQAKQPLYVYLRNHFCFDELPWKMPVPIANIINGGLDVDANLDIKEFWVIPAGINTGFEQLKAIAEIFDQLESILKDQGLSSKIGVAGGYVPKLNTNSQAWFLLKQATAKANYKLGKEIYFGFDAGANFWWDDDKFNAKSYQLKKVNKNLTAEELIHKYLKWFGDYPFLIVEDVFANYDLGSWQNFSKTLSIINNKLVIVGDELFKTNINSIRQGAKDKLINGTVIKPSQTGTISDAIAVIRQAHFNNLKIVISRRSGETGDDFIVDLAVAVGADYVKFGTPSCSQRLAKYNRLLIIENELKGQGKMI